MEKKLQVFISSTYMDLQEERQSAVQAVLDAGHIPAGMELFKSGNESQLDVIKRWIDESDVYMLILGGRYGSIEPKSGKSYTHLEYEYAIEKEKPVFAVVIKDSALYKKASEMGDCVIEKENKDKHEEFKQFVLTKICKFFEDIKDIKLAIHETLNEFQSRYDFTGWISGKELEEYDKVMEENTKLLKENVKLLKENTKLQAKLDKEIATKEQAVTLSDGVSYEEMKMLLKDIRIKLPKKTFGFDKEFTLLELFTELEEKFVVGVTNAYQVGNEEFFLFRNVAPKLVNLNLMEKVKVAGVKYQRIQTSKEGHKFLKLYRLEQAKSKNK